jgi:hypothetical protein
MKKIILLILALGIFGPSGFAASLDLGEVLSSPDKFDQKSLDFQGEVIGEALNEEEGAWINILSEPYNLSCYTQDLTILEKINYWGSYKVNGDQLKLRGVFYKNCLKHQINDFHFARLTVIAQGSPRQDLVTLFKKKLAIISLAVCLAAALIYLIYGRKN